MVATLVTCGLIAPSALAASASISIIADNPPPPGTPSGQASSYTINFTCSAVVGSSCGSNPTITVPLDLTSSNAATPDMSTWSYGVSSSKSGLVASASVVGENYVISLNEAALNAGDSDTITLTVTPPNNVTPDATTWSLTPSFQTDQIAAVQAPTPALGEATASALLSVAKTTNDGGAVYVSGNDVIYNITARCNASGAKGSLYLTDGSLDDTLPSGLDYVSATPAPSSAPTVGSSGTVSWSYGTSASLPSGCSADGTGTTSYQLVAEIDPATPDSTQLTNSVTFSGTPIGTATPAQTTATRTVTAIAQPPSSPGSFIGKSALGPLNIPSYGYDATYPGNWITPINQRPSSSPGAAEAEYTVSISYPASRAFETDLADPVPCLDTLSGVTYSSNTPSGAINGPGSIDNLCQHPAFDPTAVEVSSASLANAITSDSWTPIGITTAGTTFSLVQKGSTGSSTYFDVPAADLGQVAAIELPTDTNLTDVGMTMRVWGYADGSLQGGDALHDIATATAYPVSGPGSPSTESHSANVYIEPSTPQLGVYKAFGSLGAAPGGTTALTLQGTVSTPATLTSNVILTDLLPYGLSWHNPVSSAPFTITRSAGGGGSSVTASVEDIANFQSTGRELIRVTLPASAFTTGFDTVTAPSNFIELSVPTAATTYNNNGQLFVDGIGTGTAPTCGPGTTSTGATFESSDPLNLAGDGLVNEDYCQWSASLTVPPSGGPAFTLVKTVQGDLDGSPKYSPGVGYASSGGTGTGTYTLDWSNTGGDDLTSPVVYDILPYVGDTGVSESESATARGSQFAPNFIGLSGSLPAGVSVAYSTSTNPCRPEVFANADNPGCDTGWLSSLPADPSTVKALRFTATGTYTPGQSFSVAFDVGVPSAFVNTIAWNSAASDADYNGSALLPAEPPKVGLEAQAAPLTPTLTTAVSAADLLPGGSVSDAVTVANTGGAGGTLDWTLLGPLSPGAGRSCAGLDWTGAATSDHGTLTVSGDGTYATATSTPAATGCYSYSEQLTGGSFASSVSSAAGSSAETVLIADPSLSATVSSSSVATGTSVADVIDVTGTTGQPGTISWKLLGAVPRGPDGTCATANFSGAAVIAQGTISVSGDGQYTTPATTVPAAGCYAYVDTLTGASYGSPVSTTLGSSGSVVTAATPAATSTTSTSTSTTPTTPTPTPVTKTARLTLIKRVDLSSAEAGRALRYTIVVTNSGAGPARDVTVKDTSLTRMRVHSVTSSQGSCGHALPLTCRLATVGAHRHATIAVIATPLTAGLVVNHAHVTTASVNIAAAKAVVASATTQVRVPLVLTKTASRRHLVAGARLSYTIAIVNHQGLSAQRITLCDQLPRGLIFVSASVSTRLRDGQRCFNVASVGPHSRREFRIVARALKGASGTLTNGVSLSGSEVDPRHASAAVTVTPAPPRPTAVTG